MPVSILLCEGKRDIEVISRIIDVPGCTFRMGGGHRNIIRRVLDSPDLCVLGLRDRDQSADDFYPSYHPREWRASDGRMLGWCWERVELENYLLDPEVVSHTIDEKVPRFNHEKYRKALTEAAQSIADYSAARKAISDSLPEPFPRPVHNCWGRERGNENHPLPDELDEQKCRAHIMETMTRHRKAHDDFEQRVLLRYEELLPEFRTGAASQHFLTYFAGKDLLWAMEDALHGLGFDNPIQFIDYIIARITSTTEDIYQWLPEWQELRRLVAEY